MEIKCCMANCTNSFSKNLKKNNTRRMFHAFPKDFNLCMLWVQNSGRPEYFEDFAFAGAQPFLNRHICSDHFNGIDFIRNDPNQGVLPDSVPNLNVFAPKIPAKAELIDLEHSIFSEPEFVNRVKFEVTEQDIFDGNCSFSSTDESFTDLHVSHIRVPGTIDVYKETDEDKKLSTEFLKKYEKAVTGRCRRYNKTEDERFTRLRREALRSKLRRSQESDTQTKLRRMKNALRAAFRRQNETPEQRELRKKKDKLRSQRRRKAETQTETRMRRYNDAVRAALRRNNETEEQRMERKMKDILRAAKRRNMETPDQRMERLKKDRERASKRRMLKKITEQMTRLDNLLEMGKAGFIEHS